MQNSQEAIDERKAKFLEETSGEDSHEALEGLLIRQSKVQLLRVLPQDMTVTGYAELRHAHDATRVGAALDRLRRCDHCPSYGGGCASDQGIHSLNHGHEPVYNKEWHALESAECQKWSEWQMWQSLERTGFAPAERSREFSSYKPQTEGQQRALRWCEAYVRDFRWPYGSYRPQSIIFEGPCGTGKRHLATQILQLLHRQHYERRFRTRILSLTELMRMLSDRHEEYKREEVVIALSKLPILLLKNIDSLESGDKSGRGHLEAIADSRRERALPIIVTTQAPVTSLEFILGPSLAMYIKERAVRVLLDGSNYNDATMVTVGAEIDQKKAN